MRGLHDLSIRGRGGREGLYQELLQFRALAGDFGLKQLARHEDTSDSTCRHQGRRDGQHAGLVPWGQEGHHICCCCCGVVVSSVRRWLTIIVLSSSLCHVPMMIERTKVPVSIMMISKTISPSFVGRIRPRSDPTSMPAHRIADRVMVRNVKR